MQFFTTPPKRNPNRSGKPQAAICCVRGGKIVGRVQFTGETLSREKLERVIALVNEPPRARSNVETLPDFML